MDSLLQPTELYVFWPLLASRFISYHITPLYTTVYTSNAPSLFLLCICYFRQCGLSSLGPFMSFMSQFQGHILRKVFLKLLKVAMVLSEFLHNTYQ